MLIDLGLMLGAAGAIDMENPPTHTQGVTVCRKVKFEFVDKIAMALS